MEDAPWYDDVVFPALLRHARTTYGKAMRVALDEAGFDDIPGNGLYIIGGLALENRDIPLRRLVRELGITKQGAGQLVDALVMRGYLTRAVDENDRRQLILTLTERGRAAATVQSEVRGRIDGQLLERVGEADVKAARRTLAALIDMRREEATVQLEPVAGK
ncbi:MAG TPA: MarR family transcriptional regulator [Sphingomicrobium sp.]|nr:MarR family transcriptional regulator [Sphingomicrobium sp.]